jgi:hypothetical protein
VLPNFHPIGTALPLHSTLVLLFRNKHLCRRKDQSFVEKKKKVVLKNLKIMPNKALSRSTAEGVYPCLKEG